MLVGIRQNGEISCQPLHQKCTLFEMVINTDIDKLLLADILLWGEGEGRGRGGTGEGEGEGRDGGGGGEGRGRGKGPVGYAKRETLQNLNLQRLASLETCSEAGGL